jgi:hypothetical protein
MKRFRSSLNIGAARLFREVIALGLRKLVENDSLRSFSQ